MTFTAREISTVKNESNGSSKNYLFISKPNKNEGFNPYLKNMRLTNPILNLNRKAESQRFMSNFKPIMA